MTAQSSTHRRSLAPGQALEDFDVSRIMKIVFVLQHLHTLPHGEDDVKLVGVYATREDALEAARRLATQPGFRELPDVIDATENMQGFHINEYEIGKDHWQEGYETV